MRPTFLATPAEIREAVGWLCRRARRLDLAVAFVGQDWRDAVVDFRGPMRVICWLSSTNTDPRAVRQMRHSSRIHVRQRDSMHAKVYYAPRIGAIAGSANLSRRALAATEQSGQDEAGVLLTEAALLRAIGRWFESLWVGTTRITEQDLKNALTAFLKARSGNRPRGRRGSRSGSVRQASLTKSVHEVNPRRRPELLRLARKVRTIDLTQEITAHRLLARVEPLRINRRRLEEIVDAFVEWMGRRFLFKRAFLDRPIRDVRRAFSILFDESRDIEGRLADVIDSGWLAPLKVSPLAVVLCWRAPERYLPFNRRTHRTLTDFGLLERGASSSSPAAYARWLTQAEKYSQELGLPTPGHLDRVV